MTDSIRSRVIDFFNNNTKVICGFDNILIDITEDILSSGHYQFINKEVDSLNIDTLGSAIYAKVFNSQVNRLYSKLSDI